MPVQYGIYIYPNTCAIVFNVFKIGPYDVFTQGRLYEELLSDPHITSLQARRDSICKKYFNTISKPGSKLYGLFPAVNESGHNTRTKKNLHFRWLGQTVLRIHLSHGVPVYANFKVNFSHCVSNQFSYAISFFFFLL